MIKITFPDGNVKEFAKGTTAYQIAESISPRLAADSLAASVNGATVDLNRAIEEDASIKFYKWDDPEGKHAFWHTSSHLLAEALEALYPGIKFGIGPAIENGFYYDVDSPVPITEADLETIEKKMIELSRNKEQLIRTEVSKADALKNFTEKGDPYKVELIRDLEDGTISFYTNGAFTDLCRGPHLPNTGIVQRADNELLFIFCDRKECFTHQLHFPFIIGKPGRIAQRRRRVQNDFRSIRQFDRSSHSRICPDFHHMYLFFILVPIKDRPRYHQRDE